MEPGQLPDRAVDPVRLRPVSVDDEGQVGLDRGRCLGWQLFFSKGAEDGLAADDEDVRVVDDRGSGTQDVLEPGPVHGCGPGAAPWRRADRSTAEAFGIRQDTRERRIRRSSSASADSAARTRRLISGPGGVVPSACAGSRAIERNVSRHL